MSFIVVDLPVRPTEVKDIELNLEILVAKDFWNLLRILSIVSDTIFDNLERQGKKCWNVGDFQLYLWEGSI